MTEATEQNIKASKVSIHATWLPYVGLALAIVTTLVSIFGITEWVEIAGSHHALQHVVIFSAGGLGGVSLKCMFRKRS
jgi:hypothetical protein